MEQENKNQEIIETEIKPKKKSWFKRKKKLVITLSIIFAILLLIIIGAIAGQKGPEYSTITTQKNDLKQSVDATGKIESAETIELNFKTTGRISTIYVKNGEEVKKGKRLAMLEAGALSSSVADAQAVVKQRKASHDELLAGASDEDIRILENRLEQERQDLYSAENDLANLKITKDTELNNLKESSINTLNNEFSSAQAALEEIDNTLNDSDAEDTLSVKNTSYLSTALDDQIIAQAAFDASQSEIYTISSLSSNDKILTALTNLKITLDKIATNLNDVLDVLSATITSNDLTEAELDALKTNIKTKQSSINAARTSVTTAKSNWTNKIVYYKDQIDAYEAAIKTAQNNFKIAQTQLDAELSPPRKFEIDASLARIASAQANLSLALSRLNDAVITAPVTGTITKRNLEPGEYASLATPVLEMIGQSNLQIEVDIPESDIAKISMGQDVEITLDAFTSEDIFNGKVVFVDPAETIISEVVYYKVKVQFDELENLKNQIKPGMTANVVICTNTKENVITVPSRSVKSDNGDKYVEIIRSRRGNKTETEKIKVTTGIRGDEGIEILSGLEEGMEVITFVKE